MHIYDKTPVTVALMMILFVLIAMNLGNVHMPYSAYPPGQQPEEPPGGNPQNLGEGVYLAIALEMLVFAVAIIGIFLLGWKKGWQFIVENIVIMAIATIVVIGIFQAVIFLSNRFKGNIGSGHGGMTGLVVGPLLIYIAIAFFLIIIAFIILRNAKIEKKKPERKVDARKYVENAIYTAKLGDDVRGAILRAYRELEKMMAHYGVNAERSSTPREFERFALNSLNLSEDPVNTLVELFEIARYSHHDMNENERNEAINSLEEIRRELQKNPH